MSIFFAKITQGDNVILGNSFHLGSVSLGASTYIHTFLLKNNTSTSIYDAKIYLHIATSYQGNTIDSEDLNSILNVWPSLTNSEGSVCGLYMFKRPYNILQSEVNTWAQTTSSNDWYLFNTQGTYDNPIIIPKLCIINGVSDGTIPAGGYAQLIVKFIAPNLESQASVKCCSFGAYYQI
jgi:hypothetical protein